MARFLGIIMIIVVVVAYTVWATRHWGSKKPTARLDTALMDIAEVDRLRRQYDAYADAATQAKIAGDYLTHDMYDQMASKVLAALKEEYGE